MIRCGDGDSDKDRDIYQNTEADMNTDIEPARDGMR